ncbi:MAG TPA: SsrA-binding protein SmpB [Pirellulaceae bacterium]|nr:SsrA-binding protein SmpB [Pirellulaceae bacterium]
MAKKSGGGKVEAPQQKIISENRKARHKYEILQTLECGIVLRGSEVKSLRVGRVSLDESYARVENDEVWLLGCDIPEYLQATIWNHEPRRARKLLMHQSELRKFAALAHEKGLTLVPLKLYFNERGIAKVEIGLCRGKQEHDRREDIKKRETRREIDRAMRRG